MKAQGKIMNRKGSILIITSWILTILVIFAIGLGHRASIELKISRYQRDRLKANLLAKAAINRMIYELGKDGNNYDTPQESWANNKKIFAKIMLSQNQSDYSSVSNDESDEKVFGAIDEERKININDANIKIIEELFTQKGFGVDSRAISQILREWVSTKKEEDESKNFFKNEKLTATQELIPILEYFYQDKERAQKVYNTIKGCVTVYGKSKINVNTASSDVLLILAYGCAQDDQQGAVAEKLVDTLIKLRQEESNKGFKDIAGITLKANFSPAELSLFDNLIPLLTVKSNYFNIKVKGVSSNISKDIEAVFDRENKQMVFWHEN